MTPAINALKKFKVDFTVHEYQHEPSCSSYGLEVIEKLHLKDEQVFKTLVIEYGEKQLAVAIIPVMQKLNMKSAAKALKTKKAKMANANDVERSTGYVLGGVSPIGQKKKLATLIDFSAETQSTIFISAGKRGVELELNPNDLKQHCNGIFIPLS